jgi:hypothetical protein
MRQEDPFSDERGLGKLAWSLINSDITLSADEVRGLLALCEQAGVENLPKLPDNFNGPVSSGVLASLGFAISRVSSRRRRQVRQSVEERPEAPLHRGDIAHEDDMAQGEEQQRDEVPNAPNPAGQVAPYWVGPGIVVNGILHMLTLVN